MLNLVDNASIIVRRDGGGGSELTVDAHGHGVMIDLNIDLDNILSISVVQNGPSAIAYIQFCHFGWTELKDHGATSSEPSAVPSHLPVAYNISSMDDSMEDKAAQNINSSSSSTASSISPSRHPSESVQDYEVTGVPSPIPSATSLSPEYSPRSMAKSNNPSMSPSTMPLTSGIPLTENNKTNSPSSSEKEPLAAPTEWGAPTKTASHEPTFEQKDESGDSTSHFSISPSLMNSLEPSQHPTEMTAKPSKVPNSSSNDVLLPDADISIYQPNHDVVASSFAPTSEYPTPLPTRGSLFFPTETPTVVSSDHIPDVLKTSEDLGLSVNPTDDLSSSPSEGPTTGGLFFPTETPTVETPSKFPSIHPTQGPSGTVSSASAVPSQIAVESQQPSTEEFQTMIESSAPVSLQKQSYTLEPTLGSKSNETLSALFDASSSTAPSMSLEGASKSPTGAVVPNTSGIAPSSTLDENNENFSGQPSVAQVALRNGYLVSKSVDDGKPGNFKSNPVAIIHQGESKVYFKVEQSWFDRPMGLLSVQFEPSNNSSPRTCESVEGLDSYESTPVFSARCHLGEALIDIIVEDCSLMGVPTIDVPASCQTWHNDGRAASFTFSLPCSPHMTRKPNDCEAHAVRNHMSVAEGRDGTPMRNPINILKYDGDSVEFQVEQVWRSRSVEWISVRYETEKTTQCSTSNFVEYATQTYTAICNAGRAEIDIFVHDLSFRSNESGMNIPPTCKPWEGEDNTVAFQYTIPCSADMKSFCHEDLSCSRDIRVDQKSIDSASTGDYLAMPVHITDQTGDTVEFEIIQRWTEEQPIGWLAVDYLLPHDIYHGCNKTEYFFTTRSDPQIHRGLR